MKNGLDLIKKEAELFDYKGEDRIISSHELRDELAKTQDGVFINKTGIPSMDRILNGVEAGELIVVTGLTGQGKTTLLMTITQNMAEQNINTAWFTLEVTPRQFISKITKNGSALPLFFLPKKNIESHINWLEERIIEAKVKQDVKVVFIDHVHSIFSLERVRDNVSLEIGDMVAKIKDIAIRLNLTIFLIAHCRDNSASTTAEPRMQEIRDSGLISRLADTVIGVWRIPNSDDGTFGKLQELNEGDNRSKIRIYKNRREGVLGYFVAQHKDHYLVEIDKNHLADEDDQKYGDFAKNRKN